MASKRLRKKRLKDWSLCPLCGDPLPQGWDACVVGKTGRAVCGACLQVSQKILDMPKTQKEHQDWKLIRPQEMVQKLDRAIIGQEQAKRAVALAMWKQQLRSHGQMIPQSSLLLYGPTGCGKTALVREASRVAGLPFLSFDATTLSETGYRGRNAKDMVTELVERFGVEDAKYGIIFIDEIDKLAAFRGNEHRAVYSRGTQHSLLKLIEGDDVQADGRILSTETILFLFGGAFTGIEKPRNPQRVIGFGQQAENISTESALSVEDFVKYGMEPELMGRVGQCVPLRELGAAELRQILLESELSVFRRYQKFFQGFGRGLELSDGEIDELVANALKQHTGARGLNTMVEEWMEPKLFQLSEGM